MKHEIKITPVDFSRIESKEKTFLIIDNENHPQKGEPLELIEWSDDKVNPTSTVPKGATGKKLTALIGYVESLGNSRVVLSLLEVKKL